MVTARQSTSMDLKGLQNRVQMTTKVLSGIVIVKKTKLQNTVGKQITTLAWTRREFLTGTAG